MSYQSHRVTNDVTEIIVTVFKHYCKYICMSISIRNKKQEMLEALASIDKNLRVLISVLPSCSA